MSKCAATRNTDPPQDCDYPFCGCSEEAMKCMETLIECGWGNVETELRRISNLAMLLRRVLHHPNSPIIRHQAWDYLTENNLLGNPMRDEQSNQKPLTADERAIVEQYLADVTCSECHCPKHMHRPGCSQSQSDPEAM